MSEIVSRVNVVILIDDDNITRMDEVLKDLRACGLSVHKVMPSLGTVTGSVERHHMEKLRRLRGVASVDVSREYRVPPPDSEVQ